MTERALTLARAGDENAFRELTEPYRRELQLHCYRIVGSTQDAEDLVQETLLAAWRGLDQFKGRASIRTWLYRIATNRSLDALRANARRPQRLEPLTDPPDPQPHDRTDLARALPRRADRGNRRPGTRARGPLRDTGKRWPSRSLPAFNTSSPSSGPSSSYATCSAFARQRRPRSWTPAKPP